MNRYVTELCARLSCGQPAYKNIVRTLRDHADPRARQDGYMIGVAAQIHLIAVVTSYVRDSQCSLIETGSGTYFTVTSTPEGMCAYSRPDRRDQQPKQVATIDVLLQTPVSVLALDIRVGVEENTKRRYFANEKMQARTFLLNDLFGTHDSILAVPIDFTLSSKKDIVLARLPFTREEFAQQVRAEHTLVL